MRRIIQVLMFGAAIFVGVWVSNREVPIGESVAAVVDGTTKIPVPSPIEGAWLASQYVLASGDVHPLRGRIFFLDGDWTVVFFVLDGDGRPRRASAEGGTYDVSDDVVVFTHEYNFSQGEGLLGLSQSPLRLEIHEAGSEPEEPTQFSIADKTLTLFFPSENRMVFEKPQSTYDGSN